MDPLEDSVQGPNLAADFATSFSGSMRRVGNQEMVITVGGKTVTVI